MLEDFIKNQHRFLSSHTCRHPIYNKKKFRVFVIIWMQQAEYWIDEKLITLLAYKRYSAMHEIIIYDVNCV